MAHKKIVMEHDKKIVLIAHEHKKGELVAWAKVNRALLAPQRIYAIGATGALLEQELDLEITKLQSGPLGGYQQLRDKIDFVIFFSDPLKPLAHDPDVKALLRMAIVWNIPIAWNRAFADFMISSLSMNGECDRLVPDYKTYRIPKLDTKKHPEPLIKQ